MAAVITCPACNGRFRLGADVPAGGAVRCPHCSQAVRIGTGVSPQPAPSRPAGQLLPPARSRKKNRSLLYAGSGAAAGLVALLIVLALLLRGGDKAGERSGIARPVSSPVKTPASQQPTRDTGIRPEPRAEGDEPAASETGAQWVELRPPADPGRSCEPKLLTPSDVRVLFEETPPKQTSYRPARVVRAAAPSPFVAIGEHVVDVRSGERVGRARVPQAPGLPLALSADGRFFACPEFVGNMYVGSLKIDVVDCASGDVVQTIDVPGGRMNVKWDFLVFTADNHLFAVMDRTREGTQLFLWDAASGAVLKQWPAEDLGKAKALSPDGRYFAAQTMKFARVQVFDVLEGKNVVALARPSILPEHVQGLYSVRSIAFSPDGLELAGVVDLAGHRQAIVVWDGRGNVVDEVPFEQSGDLVWLPDGSGWLAGIHENASTAFGGSAVISRRLRSVAWHALMPSGLFSPGFAGEDHLLLCGYRDSAYQVLSLQWSGGRIRSALQCLESGTAVIAPGQAVAVEVDVGEVRFAERNAVAQDLRDAVAKRLEERGFQVAADSEVTMRVRYAEEAGDVVTIHHGNVEPVYATEQTIMSHILFSQSKDGGAAALKKYEDLGLVERDGPFLRIKRGRHKVQDAGPTASARNTVGKLELGLVKQGSDDPAWSRTITRQFGGARQGEAFNDKTVRDDMFRTVVWFVEGLTIPTLVPRDPKAPVLPILEDVTPVVAPHARTIRY